MDLLLMREIKTMKLYKLNINKNVEFIKSIMEIDVLQYFIENILIVIAAGRNSELKLQKGR